MPLLPDSSKIQIKEVTLEFSQINHLLSQELRNLIQQLTNNTQVEVEKCDDNMFNSNRRQEKYPYNSYHPSRGSWNRHGESDGRIFSKHNQNDLSTSEYSTNYDGQNYKSSEGENWTCEYEEEQVGSFSNNTNFQSFRYKRRGVYRNSNVNQRNNYSYDSYHKKPYRRYEDNKQTFGFHQRFHNQTSDSDGKRMYNARESNSNFGSESYSYKNYGSQNWEDDYETVDMDISDSENNYSRHQKRKSNRYENIPYKKKCYEHNVKTQSQTLRLKHSDSSDITDDDYVGIGRTDVRQNSLSSSSRDYQCKRHSTLDKELPPKINTDSEMKKDSINAESKGGCSMKKQLSPCTKTSFENPNKPVGSSATIKKSAVKPANNSFINSNLKYVEIQPESSTTKEIGSNQCSSEDPSNLENKSFSSPKCPNQNSTSTASPPEKSVTKSDVIRKTQENLKQLQDVMKSPVNAQKPHRNITEVSIESKKSGKLLPSNDVQKQNKSKTEDVSESKKLPPSSSSSGDTQKQSKNVVEVSSEPKKPEKLPPPGTTPDYTPKQHKNLEVTSESKKPEKLPPPKSSFRSQSKEKLNCCDSKKTKTNSVKKERALSLDGQSSRVSGDKKLKLAHRKSTGSEQVKEMSLKVTETKSNSMDQDISDSVIDDILADLYTQRYIVADDDKAVKNKQSKKSIVAEVDKAVKNKPSSTSTSKQTPAAERKISSKPKEKVAKKIENKVKAKDSPDDKVVKKKDETGLTGKLTTPSKSVKKSLNKSTDSKVKDDTKAKKRKIESENAKPGTLNKSNATASKSTPNQNDESSKACGKNIFTKETTIPSNGLNTKSNEVVQKLPKNSEVQANEPTTINNEVKTKRMTEVKTVGLSEHVVKPAKRITRRRGKSCDTRSIRELDDLETLNFKPLTRSKSVEPHEFTSFRITRSKSPFYGLCTGLPPPTRLRSRSRSSSISKSLEEDRQENSAPKKNNSDRILKASDEVKVYKPFLIDMDHRKRVGGYSPRDDDEEVAMHMANYTSSSCMIQHRAIDPRDPRKSQFAKQKPIKNGKELIKLKDFVREQLEQNSNKDKLKETKASNVSISSKGEHSKTLTSSKSETKICNKVNVRLEELEKCFPLPETNKNCMRLNVSNGTEEKTITIQRADIVRMKKDTFEEANVLIIDSVEKAQISDIPDDFHKATATVITIQEANQSEKIIDLTLDDPCEEQSDLSLINDIDNLTEQLLEMCGDEMKASVVNPESSNSRNCLLNILESPVQRRENQNISEIVKKAVENNTTAPYTITIRPLVPLQSDEEAQNIIIEIPDFPITELIQMNSPNLSEIVTTNCVITQPSNQISTECDIPQIDATQKSLEVSSNAKETNVSEAQQNSSGSITMDTASLILNLSTMPRSETASSQNEIVSLNSGTIATDQNAIQLSNPASIVSNESNQGCLPSNLIQNLSMASSDSALKTHLLSSVNKRRLSNKTVQPQCQTGSTLTSPNSTALTQHPTSTALAQHPTSTALTQHPTSSALTQHPTSIALAQHPTSTALIQHPTSTALTQHPTSTALTQHPISTALTQHPTSTALAQHPTSTALTQHPTSTALTQHHTSTALTQHPTLTASTQHPTPTALAQHTTSTAPPASVENQNLPIIELEYVVEKHGRRLSQDNLSRKLSEVPPNRIAPCNHHAHSNTNANLYKDFLSNNVYYILKYQCVMDMSQHLFPSYVNSLSETSSRKYLESATQIFFGKVMCTVEKDMRRYYNEVKLGDLNFAKFLVDLDIELARSGQKLFWKWNLEFLCRLLCSSDACGIPLDTCYQQFISELKKYYDTYVSKHRNGQRTSRNIQNKATEKTSRPSNISVVPLATLQDPALHNPNLSTSNNSRMQKSNSDQHQRTQSIQITSNNTVMFPVTSTTLQTSSSATQRSNSDQQQRIQSLQASNNTVIFPIPSKSLQTSSPATQKSSSDQQQLIQSVQRSNNTVFLPMSVQTNISKTQKSSSDKHQRIQSIQKSNSLAPSTSSNQTVTNQSYGMTRQQFELFLQQVEKYKEIVLILQRQIISSSTSSNHYIGGNVSGRPAHCRPTQESANQRVSNLEHLLEQSRHSRQQLNLQRLLTGQRSQKDYSQNLHNMINARLSNLSGGSVSQEPAQQQGPSSAYPLHLTMQYQQNKAAPLRPEINSFAAAPQQQQSRINLSPQNNVTEISSIERIFNRFMTNMENASLLNAGVLSHPQSQVHVPRKEVAQNSTESQNLSAPELNVTLELNIIDTQNKNAQQRLTQNTSTQNSCTIPTQKQSSSNWINSHNRRVSVQEQTTSSVIDNQVQHHSVIAAQNEDVSSENDQTSDANKNSPSVLLLKEENVEVANEPQGRDNDEFIDFENYLTNTHGENWDDDIEIFWPENYVVVPLAEEVKNEDDGVQLEVEAEDPIPRSISNDSGIDSPIDIVLPSQVQLPCSLYEGRFCFCGKHAVYVCTCKLQMYCSEACQMSDWQRHAPAHR